MGVWGVGWDSRLREASDVGTAPMRGGKWGELKSLKSVSRNALERT